MSMDPITGGPPGDVLEALRSGRIQGADERLSAATKLMEGSFYQELFKAMRETVPEGGMLSGGSGEEMFEGLLDQQVAESAALKVESGLANALFRYFRGYDAPKAGGASGLDGGDAARADDASRDGPETAAVEETRRG